MNIGDFARLGQVSPRMLRHYDDVGLLSPETVNAVNGYRGYGYRQLDRLHRLVALRDLGFGLEQIRDLLDDDVSVEQIRGMLHLRRAQIAQAVDDEQARLRRVEAHLHALEETTMPAVPNVVIKRTVPVRIAEATGLARGFGPEHIPPVMMRLIPTVLQRLGEAGIAPLMSVAWYEVTEMPDPARGGQAALETLAGPIDVIVHVGFDIGDAELADTAEVAVVELPVVDVASAIHSGTLDDVEATYASMLRWIDDSGYQTAGYSRELYLEWHEDAPESNVTELQFPLVAG